MSDKVFQLAGGKAHILVDDLDTDRFPFGRAKCAPFDRRPQDELLLLKNVKKDYLCRLCAK